MEAGDPTEVQGHVDGYRSGRIYGWAWRPAAPQDVLSIEVIVDGVVVAETAAWVLRPDLSAAGIGDGRHGFDIPVNLDVERLGVTRVIVRVKDGAPLPGALQRPDSDKPSLEEAMDDNILAFVNSVLNPTATAVQREQLRSSPGPDAPAQTSLGALHLGDSALMNFIVYSTTNTHSLTTEIGGPEYSYYFVARAFNPVLSRLGTVHVAKDPVDDVNRIYEECVANGENCVFVYYAPPHRMILGTRCPVIAVIAWEYPNLPDEVWDGDARNDWRRVLRETAGAIMLSEFAATAVRNAMGNQFPVLAAPAPVWDRLPAAGIKLPMRPPDKATLFEFEGTAFDSRGQVFKVADPPRPPRLVPGAAPNVARIALDGVVFTSVFAPKDARKNWFEMVTAFVAAFQDTPDATLVFKMIGRDISHWWWELHDLLAREPVFRCRVIALQGYLSDACYAQLVGATHWILNASTAEGLCLPLLEFMCAGRPAVAPAHTAMADYINSSNALVVGSEDDYCAWPQDSRSHLTTTHQSIDWISLRDGLREAYYMTKEEPERYAAAADAAMATMHSFCTDAVVIDKVAKFLGLRMNANASTQDTVSA